MERLAKNLIFKPVSEQINKEEGGKHLSLKGENFCQAKLQGKRRVGYSNNIKELMTAKITKFNNKMPEMVETKSPYFHCCSGFWVKQKEQIFTQEGARGYDPGEILDCY